jgi:hypothetical protein
MEPIAEQLELPVGYGRPTELLEWSKIRQRLEAAEQYWLATTRTDGRLAWDRLNIDATRFVFRDAL